MSSLKIFFKAGDGKAIYINTDKITKIEDVSHGTTHQSAIYTVDSKFPVYVEGDAGEHSDEITEFEAL